MEPLAIIILAAGLGKRMGSDLPKVVHTVRGEALLGHVLKQCLGLNAKQIVVVTGHKGELVRGFCEKYTNLNLKFAVQEKQLGTGDAVKAALPTLSDFSGTVLILYGDMPLIREHSLSDLVKLHHTSNATLSLLSAKIDQPGSYGRIVRDSKSSNISAIVEAKDCSTEQLKINEINVGVYAVDSAFLTPAIKELKNENAQKEYYLTDIVERAIKEGQQVSGLEIRDWHEGLGINTRFELLEATMILNSRKIEALISAGVEFDDKNSVLIEDSVEISTGVRIGPNVQILGKSKIDAGTVIEGTAYLKCCQISKNVMVKFGVRAEETTIGEGASVGPFANLRPGTVLGAESRIGNFVETKKTTLGRAAKANHLTYLGDCEVGEGANIGAGTITCNYDGYNKFQTKIGPGAFIGSNTALVAPVKIGQGATVGAGSVITKDVEADALAVTRSEQRTVAAWSKAKRERSRA